MRLEKMDDFFGKRVDGYDNQMINNVEGCKEGYKILADFMPENPTKLLDLGCGTGLELAEIFKRYPDIKVTAVDLTKAMLDKLLKKYPNKDIKIINKSYFEYDLGENKYDVIISFQTMHHFSHEEKIKLYQKIYRTLRNGGKYIEGDYMVIKQEEEDFYYSENKKIRKEQGVGENEFYHYDTPCTIENQIKMFKEAGFEKSEYRWRKGNTTIIENIK